MQDKVKERIYLRARMVERKSIKQSWKKAKISSSTAARCEADPRVKSEMYKALEACGATSERIAETVLESLSATKVISANIVNQSGDGMADATIMTKDFIDIPDYAVRCKAAELAGRFRGDFVERSEIELKGAITIRIKSNVKG